MPGNTSPPTKSKYVSAACFNEAPAKCRGIRVSLRISTPSKLSFNEAPAKCRGIHYKNGKKLVSRTPLQ